MIDKFNIRVYGIWIQDNKILISNENIDGFRMVKLPGGGLEFGEGPIDCLKREFSEELNVAIRVKHQVFTTDRFIQSAFKRNEQVLALHYLVESDELIESYKTIQKTRVGSSNVHQFVWQDLNHRLLNELTFEMDRIALEGLLNKAD